jgi:hypothetical protein
MSKTPVPQAMSDETRRQKALEAERLAAALRENLRRRKQQARARAAGEEPPAAPAADADGSQGG